MLREHFVKSADVRVADLCGNVLDGHIGVEQQLLGVLHADVYKAGFDGKTGFLFEQPTCVGGGHICDFFDVAYLNFVFVVFLEVLYDERRNGFAFAMVALDIEEKENGAERLVGNAFDLLNAVCCHKLVRHFKIKAVKTGVVKVLVVEL